MKRIINMLAGGENATPLKKGVVYAALGTLVALILAIAILVVSSIAYNLTDNAGTEPENGDVGGDDGASGGGNNKTVEFTTLENISELAEKVDSTTASLQGNRTAMTESDQRYYDAWDNSVPAKAQKAIDSLLVKYYDKHQDNNIVVFSTDSVTVSVSVSDAEKASECTPITAATHKWIFDNACNYGLIYTGNTFRYVGIPLAKYLRTSNELTAIKTKAADSAQKLSDGYSAYYVKSEATEEIKLPKNVSFCEVIADGANGYIVIYKK